MVRDSKSPSPGKRRPVFFFKPEPDESKEAFKQRVREILIRQGFPERRKPPEKATDSRQPDNDPAP